MEGEQKVSLCCFGADQKIASSLKKKVFWGIPKHKQQDFAYFQTHYDYVPQKMPLMLAV